MIYSNPRKQAIVENWPSGGKRVTATFVVESNKSGSQRVSRQTTGKPKATTYHERMTIVDGDDGKIYAIGIADGQTILVWPGTMKYPVYHYRGPEFDQIMELLGH